MSDSAFPIVPPANERGETPPGFPYPEMGLTKREYFAAQALPACIYKCVPQECADGETMEQMFARKSFLVADAMIKASKGPSDD